MFFSFAGSMRASLFIPDLLLAARAVLRPRIGAGSPRASSDGVQARDCRIHIIYDHKRTPLGEVLMATFTEEDVSAGEPVSDKIRLRGKVARLPIEQADAQVEQ